MHSPCVSGSQLVSPSSIEGYIAAIVLLPMAVGDQAEFGIFRPAIEQAAQTSRAICILDLPPIWPHMPPEALNTSMALSAKADVEKSRSITINTSNVFLDTAIIPSIELDPNHQRAGFSLHAAAPSYPVAGNMVRYAACRHEAGVLRGEKKCHTVLWRRGTQVPGKQSRLSVRVIGAAMDGGNIHRNMCCNSAFLSCALRRGRTLAMMNN